MEFRITAWPRFDLLKADMLHHTSKNLDERLHLEFVIALAGMRNIGNALALHFQFKVAPRAALPIRNTLLDVLHQ